MTELEFQRRVIIDVSGGVAYVASAPDDVDVVIHDYDDCEAGSDADYCKKEN